MKESHIDQWGHSPAFWCPTATLTLHEIYALQVRSTQIPQAFLNPHSGLPVIQVQICGIVRGIDAKRGHIQLFIDDSSGKVGKIYFFFNEFTQESSFDFSIGMTMVIQGKVNDYRDERSLIATRYWLLKHPNEEVLYRALRNRQRMRE